MRALTNGFDGVAKNASHTKGRAVHYDVEHDMVNRAVTFNNVGVVPGDLLLKHNVPLWNVQKIVQMVMVRHFEQEKRSVQQEKHNGETKVFVVYSDGTLISHHRQYCDFQCPCSHFRVDY